MNNFHIEYNVPTIQPPITERAVSHLSTIGVHILHKLGAMASEGLNVLDMAIVDANEGTHMLQDYNSQKRAARLGAIASSYELV